MRIKFDEAGNKYWRPNRRQEDFLSVPYSVFEAFFGGAAGPGKSEVLLAIPIVNGPQSKGPRFYQCPGFNGVIFRKTYPQLEESLIPRSKEAYPIFGGVYNDTKHVWTFPCFDPKGKRIGQSTVRFSHLETEEDARDHDTAEYNYAGFDELTQFIEYVYIYILSRVRSANPGLPAFSRSASNPGNIGHSWVKSRFVQPNPLGYTLIKDAVSKSRRIFIPARLQDNPDLLSIDPEYGNRLLLLPEVEREAKLSGNWDIFEGQVFAEFRQLRHPSEPDNAVHVCAPFPIPDYWPKFVSIDWGFTAKTIALGFAVSPAGRVYVFKRYEALNTKVSVWAADVARIFSCIPNIKEYVLDPSAWNRRGDEKTIVQQFTDSSGITPTRADNDRIGGKLLLHEYLRWTPRPPRRIPGSNFSLEESDRIFRLYGERARTNYVESFLPEKPEANLPKLQIFDLPEMRSKNGNGICETILACVYDDINKEDVAEFNGDDDYDCLRYGLKRAHKYILESETEYKRLQDVSDIIEPYKRGEIQAGDMYLQMKILEWKQRRNSVKPIPRGRIGRKSSSIQRVRPF